MIIARASGSGEWDGTCDMCGTAINGMIHVDHIQPVSGPKDAAFYRRSNLQFLHPGCHSKKTREDTVKGATRNA